MKGILTRFGVSAGVVVVAGSLLSVSAFAVPSDRQAWSSQKYGITVYHDELDAKLYWFVPLIRFESTGGKTLLRPTTLANGKVEYVTRIIPYFPEDMRELVTQKIPEIRDDSQLKPIVARNIGIALPDFDYKFSSPSVTSYQYLDVPRLVRFQLDKDEAALFDQLYRDDLGVPVEFTISYDGVMTDKFYNIDIDCKKMERELSTNFKPSVGVGDAKVYLGLDLEFAFLNNVKNSTNDVNITSKGDVTGMQEMLNRVMNLCFDPVDGDDPGNGSGRSSYPPSRGRSGDDIGGSDDPSLPPRRTSPARGNVIDNGFDPRSPLPSPGMFGRSAAETLAAQEATLLKEIHDHLDLDRKSAGCDPKAGAGCGVDPGLLPAATLKAGYVFKKTALDRDNQAVVKEVDLKDTVNTATIVGALAANEKAAEKIEVERIADRKFTVSAKDSASEPLGTGIRMGDGEQYAINAEFVFNAASAYGGWKSKQYAWDPAWPKTDGDLYYRIGGGEWTPVNRHTVLVANAANGGDEIQFSVDRSAIFNKIPEKLRKGNILIGPAFTLDGIDPQFVVQISGKKIESR
jgi:hypothetical protein